MRSTIHSKSLLFGFSIAISVLVSCSSGGGGSASSTPELVNRAYTIVEADGQLIAVNPASPDQTVVLEENTETIMAPVLVAHTMRDPDSNTLFQTKKHLLYVKNGRVWLTDVSIGSELNARQLSSETAITKICAVATSASDDRVQGRSGAISYAIPGDSGLCDDFSALNPNQAGTPDPLASYQVNNVGIRIQFDTDSNTPATNVVLDGPDIFGSDYAIVANHNRDSDNSPLLLGRLIRNAAADLLWYPGDDVNNPILLASGISRMVSFYNGNSRFLLLLNNDVFTYLIDDLTISQSLYTFLAPPEPTVTNIFQVANNRAYFIDGKQITFVDLQPPFPPGELFKTSDENVVDLQKLGYSNRYFLIKEKLTNSAQSNLVSINARTGDTEGERRLLAQVSENAIVQFFLNHVYINDPENATTLLISITGEYTLDLSNLGYSAFLNNSFSPSSDQPPSVILANKINESQYDLLWQNLSANAEPVNLGTINFTATEQHPYPTFQADHLDNNLIYLRLTMQPNRLYLANKSRPGSMTALFPEKQSIRLLR